MMITLCPGCGKKLSVPESTVGKRAKCSGCKTVFAVHAQEPEAESAPPPVRANAPSVNPPAAIAPEAKPTKSIPRDDAQQRRQLVMAGFQGTFRRPATTTLYRIGLFGASLISLMLPILYVGFIASIVWLVTLHLRHNWTMLDGARGKGLIFLVLAYISPAIAGAISIVFMLKPLLAPRRESGSVISLTRDMEPLLFDFVAQICKDVGAPFPKRIDVDCDVNASASFQHGWKSLFKGSDLVLTIGLPLAAGMSLTQFAGVLAHEFGHFSQGAGMRVTYILRSINLWFLRVIYERDAWDEWLEDTSQSLDLRFSWVLYIARAAVWFSRRVLWCLYYFGNLLTGFMQRQMEFDADRYEITMAGRSTFQSSFKSLRALGAGFEKTMEAVGRTIQEKRFVDNLPKLISVETSRLSKEDLHSQLHELEHDKTGLFDTHPCDRDRIAASQKAPDEGRFRSNLPAHAVFLRFPHWCHSVTKDFYESTLEIEVKNAKWVAADSIAAEEGIEKDIWESLDRLGRDCMTYRRPLNLPSYKLESPSDIVPLLKTLERSKTIFRNYEELCRQSISIEAFDASQQVKRLWRTAIEKIAKNTDESFFEPNEVPIDFRTYRRDPKSVNQFYVAAAARGYQASRLLMHPEVASQIPESAHFIERSQKAIRAIECLEPALLDILLIEDMTGYLQCVLAHFETNEDQIQVLYGEALRVCRQIIVLQNALRAQFDATHYPFEHADESISIANYLLPASVDESDIPEVLDQAMSFVQNYIQLRARCHGTLQFIAEKIEAKFNVGAEA